MNSSPYNYTSLYDHEHAVYAEEPYRFSGFLSAEEIQMWDMPAPL